MSSSRNASLDEEESRVFPSDDTSSMGGSSTITFTDSLAESWFTDRHGESQGRKVQAINQSYRFPSDETQKTAEEYASYWKLEKFGLYPKEVAARVEDLLSKPGSRVLDVGQGMSGLWLISMAERFPGAECLGVDSQPLASDTIPSNMTTELFDVSVGLPYPDEFFDVINHSHISQSFCSTFTYENLCSEITRCLKPRGVYFFFEAFRMGGRGVDPEADRIGEIFRNYSKMMCSPYFFLDAGYSEEEARMWTSSLENEAEKMRSCRPGEGIVARHSLGWAVKKV